MRNRNGLVADTSLTKATGTAEREAAISMIEDLSDDGHITLCTNKGYDTQDFVAEMRRLGVTPHVTPDNKKHRSPLTAAPRAMPATRPACASASGSRRCSAGRGRWRPAQDPAPRHRACRPDVRLHGGRLHLVRLPKLPAGVA